EAERGPALCFDCGAHGGAGALERRLARDPALDEIDAVEFELWLDQTHQPCLVSCELEHMRQHESLRNEAHGDDNRVRRFAEYLSRQRARVNAFERKDARVRRETRIELSVTDVDSDNLDRAAREQDIGETSGRGADVEADEASRIELEGVERGVE